jgi:hypothetical protein
MDYMARFAAKLFRSEVSCLRKRTFAFRVFWQNRPLTYFWGDDRLVRSGAKTISHQNFSPFCRLSPQNRFSEKHVSGQNFFTKPHHNNYRGPMDYMARFTAKLFRSEVSCLRKGTFAFRVFWLNRPLTYFWGHADRLVRSGAKTISHQNFSAFCRLSPQNRFPEKPISG